MGRGGYDVVSRVDGGGGNDGMSELYGALSACESVAKDRGIGRFDIEL